METKLPTPIKLALPVTTSEDPPPPPPAPPPGEGEGSGPRFIPLAVAIDLGMTPPIGSIRTTEVEVLPAGTGKRPRPVRRHLRLLPGP